MKSYSIIVKGLVQGVYYRKTIHANANKMGVTGFVKNLDNGDVLVGVNLKVHQYEPFLTMLKKGSSYSKVNFLEISPSTTSYKEFTIEY